MTAEAPERFKIKYHNRGAIKDAFEQIFLGNDPILNDPMYSPLDLIADSEGNYHVGLTYRKLKDTVFVLNTAIIKETDAEPVAIAATDYFFEDLGGLTDVSSNTRVSPAYRQKGIGSGLALLTDEVIYYAIDRFPQLRRNLVIAQMVDAAEGEGIVREGRRIGRLGWTGRILDGLGYTYSYLRNDDDQPIWTKTYHMPLEQAQV